MAEEQVPERGRFSIVLVGSMNPRIHHPYWYKINGLLTEAEVAEALTSSAQLTGPSASSGQFMVLSDVANFSTAGIQVTCQPSRWDVATDQPSLRPRIRDLAQAVFDGKLRETPLQLVGFNNNLSRRVPDVIVGRALASRVATTAFGFEEGQADVAAAQFSFGVASGSPVHVQISAGALPDEVVVAVNSNHSCMGLDGGGTYFDVGPVIDAHFDADLAQAARYADRVVQALRSQEA